MQTLLFSSLVALRPQISFSSTINGKELLATLTHKEAIGAQILYHVLFSDGHADAYAVGDLEVQEGFGRTRTMDAYEEAIFGDLCVLKHLEKGGPFVNLRVCEKGGESFNVWIREKSGYYSVYYKGQYQFTLRKKDGWQSGTVREKGYAVNERLAKLLADYLEEHLLKKTRLLRTA